MNKNDNEILNELRNMIDNTYFKDMNVAIRTNGKSKSIEDFNILDEYRTRFKDNPSVLRISHDDSDFFSYLKFKENVKNIFKNSEIVFSDNEYNIKRDKYINNREIWIIENGYMLNIWTSESRNIFTNPERDIKMDKYDQLIEGNTLLIPPINSENFNIDIQNKIIDLFRNNTIKEYNRNSIGMMSVENGELYVKDFSLDKKFKIKDLDLHYGKNFKPFHSELFKKLKSDKKGLVLLHGTPGTGKTYYIRYLLQCLSKTDKKVLYFPPSMVETITDPSFFNFITNWTSENGKNSILLIEDAEPLLLSREKSRNMGITNLLNLTDGILNDILSIQIIATFNTNLNELDNALLRPERLIARKEFKKLPKNEAINLAKILNIDVDNIKEDMSLAEIYSIKNNNEVLIHGVDETSENKPSIGFNKKN